MSSAFDDILIDNKQNVESVDSALTDELEKDLYKHLCGFRDGNMNFPYVVQITKMLLDFRQNGYMSYIINHKELPDNLQDLLYTDNIYDHFIEASQRVVKFMLYEYERDFIDECIRGKDSSAKNFAQICNHLPAINIRIKNFKYDLAIQDVSEAIPIKALKSAFSSQIQTIKGIVIAASHVSSSISMMVIECDNCEYFHIIDFNKAGKLGNLSKDKCPECEEGKLKVVETQVDDTQIITLQDLNDATTFSTSTPVSLRCKVSQELTNKIQIGDSVIVTGLLRLDLDDKEGKKQYNDKVKSNDYYNQMSEYRLTTGSGPSFDRIFQVNFIETNKVDDFSNFEDALEKIKELQKRPDLYELLIKSFCPKIYGHEAEKEGILLALVGGVGRNTTNGNIDKRGNIHVMFISDPSTGKSEMLKYTAKLMNRGLYVSATSSTKVGLTGSVRKDEASGKYMIEAGGILRANGSVMCIDEIGKLDADSQAAIYEVAEQETCTFAKAGIVKTFDVNITLIVGGNPRDGRYNPTLTTGQNMSQFEAPFLSRFDAKYLLRDIPIEETDKNIVAHVLNQTNGEFDTTGLIEFDLLAKYIQYIRNYGVQPKLTKAAIKYLQEYYWNQRKNYNPDDPTSPVPIAVRELEGIDRMCKARARLTNQEIVDVKDVMKVTKTFEKMLYNLAYDKETGQIDTSGMNGAKPSKEMGKEAIVLKELKELAKNQGTDDRIDPRTFYNHCKAKKLGNESEIEKILENYQGLGMLMITSEAIIINTKE